MTVWRDCFDIANQNRITLTRCGKLLGQLYPEGYLQRRTPSQNNNGDYEYLLRADIDNAS
jgi:hypothetical protein